VAELIYFLCATAALFCAALLTRNFIRTRLRLALWASLCFVGLAVNNLLLVIDLVVVPDVDLSLVRSGVALAAMILLVVGLVREDA
jgi:hypothetical protein